MSSPKAKGRLPLNSELRWGKEGGGGGGGASWDLKLENY